MWFWKTKTQQKLDCLIEGQKEILCNQRRLSQNQVLIGRRLVQLEELLFDLLLKSKPGQVSIILTGERSRENMADMILFSVSLPPKSAPDVASREVTIKIGEAEEVRSFGPEVVLIEGLEGEQDVVAMISLVDVDDAGNKSEASVAEAVLADTVAPPQPGALGIIVVGESHPEPEAPEESEAPSEPEEPVDEPDAPDGGEEA